MAQVPFDNFVRANENPLSDGGNWSALIGTVQPLQVLSNALAPTTSGTGAGCSAYWNAVSFSANQYGTYTVGTSTVSTNNGGVLLRVQTGAAQQSCYTGQFQGIVGGTCNLIITVIQANVETTLATTTSTVNTGDVLTFSAFGNQLSLYQNGVLKLQTYDATWTSGPAGVHLNIAVTGSLSTLTAGPWTAGNQVSLQSAATCLQSTSTAANQASPLAKAYPNPNTKGTLLVCVGRCAGTNPVVTDSQGNSWTTKIHNWRTSNTLFMAYAPNAKAGANTVTVTEASGSISFSIAEYPNVATTSPLDQNGFGDTSTGTWTSANTGFVTTTKPGELIIIGLAEGTSIITPTAGGAFTLRADTTVSSLLDSVQIKAGILSGGAVYASAVTGAAGILSFFLTGVNSSPQDCRDYGIFPNAGVIQNSGAVFYTGQTSPNIAIPSADSREFGAPTDSRTASPQNSRVGP